MDSTDSTALLVFLCLFLIYTAISCLCLFRAIRLHNFTTEWRQTKIFYVTVLFQSLLRAICFLVIITNLKSLSDVFLFLLLSIPDSLFIVSYLLLIWQMLTVFYYAHISQLRMTFFNEISKRPKYSKASKAIAFILTIWIGTQIMLYFLLSCSMLHERDISKEIGIVNFILPSCVMAMMVYFQIKYSGLPTRSKVWKSKLNRINCVALFWSLARFAEGIDDILAEYSEPNISENITNRADHAMDTTAAALMILSLIISEVICMALVLDYGFIGIFLFSEEEGDQSILDIDEKNSIMDEKTHEFSTLSMVAETSIKLSDLTIIDEYFSKKNGLGKLYKATYKGMTVILRKIVFKRLSGYVIEEFQEEINIIQTMICNHLLPIIGVIIDLPTIGIVYPFVERGSLYNALHVEKVKFSYREKLRIACDIAECLEQIHSQGKAHGHLTSDNILLKDDGEALISDLGFLKVKKYAGIISGYTNKSGWSSPEFIKEKRLTPLKAVPSDDVYSFGMMVWEIMSEQEPFPGYSKDQLCQQVVVEGYRPKIPANIPEVLCNLIMSCWNTDPEKRPPISLLARSLERISN
ncbi:unnamed protein product [Blepharisma stoltei]|uniref:Protein kinase domain-containing protein n=1 Tax=Blepharisma stoltei TaxID=1481888 RepID=A0AAU9IKN6_9CILI|nr:unnamed protein product [Blepharisma stoltei]